MVVEDKSYFWRDGDPLWYKDAIIYEVHVRAFFDSNGDGIGDFNGLTEKLDYLSDLGINTIWLLPFYPSPLRDDGYDVSDYMAIHPNYGTLQDFRLFLREANYRGLRVVTELVVNHTSDQHVWFQKARQAKAGSPEREYYVWNSSSDKFKDARIIFKDFESSNWSWDPVARAYYWHRFYSHQPDLNFDNPHVHQAVERALDFWFKMGVSGLRLDAVPYLFEREGTNCENLPETHEYLKKLRGRIDERFRNRMLLAEANQWSEDAVAYFGDGDESHMAFNFPLMPRMFMAIRMEDRFPIIDILQHTPEIPETCQWASFLRNHDELTLEMVTDEERDYMNRTYAYDTQARINLGIRRRLAPLLNNDRKKIELMNALLFSLPGTPVLYYGDEIGMGDNFYLGDRNGVRTPMQWSPDRNAGFSRANPQRLYLPVNIDPEYHYEAVNVETQQNNPDSFLWWMRRILSLRKRYKAFGRGSIEFLYPDNKKILAFIRRYENEVILVVNNLSRSIQHASLDLSEFGGQIPVELFGQTEFPVVGEQPYFLSLAPFGFYWLSIEPQRVEESAAKREPLRKKSIPVVTMSGEWKDLYNRRLKPVMNEVLQNYILQRRWYGGKGKKCLSAEIEDFIPTGKEPVVFHMVIIRLEYTEGEPERYFVPIAFAGGDDAVRIQAERPESVIAQVKKKEKGETAEYLIYDATQAPEFRSTLLKLMSRRRRAKAGKGELVSSRVPRSVLTRTGITFDTTAASTVMSGEQSNTSIAYGNQLKFKLYRKLEEGVSPELEIGRYLTETKPFPQTAPLIGSLEYENRRQREPVTLGVLHGFVPNEGDGWHYTLDLLERYFETVLSHPGTDIPLPVSASYAGMIEEALPPLIEEIIGPYQASVHLLARRTAEMHLALASATKTPDFSPEVFSAAYQRSLSHSMRGFSTQVLQLLRRQQRKFSGETRAEARKVLEMEPLIMSRFQRLIGPKISGMRIRCHGDFHLGQILYTGNDFSIIDFEGEPARHLSERRIKRSPLRDIAGMIRSFHYAAYAALKGRSSAIIRPEDQSLLEQWGRAWALWVSAIYLKSYMEYTKDSTILPRDKQGLSTILDAYLLDKALYEVNYELNNRPDWVGLPLQGIIQMLEPEAAVEEKPRSPQSETPRSRESRGKPSARK